LSYLDSLKRRWDLINSAPVSHFKTELAEQIDVDKEAIEAIDTCSKHQKVITGLSRALLTENADDVLDLSKLDANKLSLNSIQFNPKRTLEAVVKMFEAELKLKQIEIHFSFPATDLMVRGDSDR
jgi:signal transduction histidine kinase